MIEDKTIKRLATCSEIQLQMLQFKIYNLEKEVVQAKRMATKIAVKKISLA